MDYVSNTKQEREYMLKEIGVEAVEEIFDSIPEEIKLKRELEESKKIALTKSNIDIRQKVNKTGDIARICIGINEAGNRVWKKATELTEADIERRNRYIAEIKQRNAKKY